MLSTTDVGSRRAFTLRHSLSRSYHRPAPSLALQSICIQIYRASRWVVCLLANPRGNSAALFMAVCFSETRIEHGIKQAGVHSVSGRRIPQLGSIISEIIRERERERERVSRLRASPRYVNFYTRVCRAGFSRLYFFISNALHIRVCSV